jgi:hypothetical protein
MKKTLNDLNHKPFASLRNKKTIFGKSTHIPPPATRIIPMINNKICGILIINFQVLQN